jgi:hypothetical protein
VGSTTAPDRSPRGLSDWTSPLFAQRVGRRVGDVGLGHGPCANGGDRGAGAAMAQRLGGSDRRSPYGSRCSGSCFHPRDEAAGCNHEDGAAQEPPEFGRHTVRPPPVNRRGSAAERRSSSRAPSGPAHLHCTDPRADHLASSIAPKRGGSNPRCIRGAQEPSGLAESASSASDGRRSHSRSSPVDRPAPVLRHHDVSRRARYGTARSPTPRSTELRREPRRRIA